MRIRMKYVVFGVFWTIVAANAIFWITTGAIRNGRGNYAGLHYDSARGKALDAMALRYGAIIAQHLTFGKPDVLNTHMSSPTYGTGQVRIFHFIGARGARYCVPVSDSVPYWQSANAITRGCKW